MTGKKTARSVVCADSFCVIIQSVPFFDLLVFAVVVDCAELSSNVITEKNSWHAIILPEKSDEIDVRW